MALNAEVLGHYAVVWVLGQDGLGNRLIEPTVAANGAGRIVRQTRLGGILSFYSREAA